MNEFLSSPYALLTVALIVLAIAVLMLMIWLLSIDRRMRGVADDLEMERRKVAEMQMSIGKRNAARNVPPRQTASGMPMRQPVAQGAEAPRPNGAGRPQQGARPRPVEAQAAPRAERAPRPDRPVAQQVTADAVQRPRPAASYDAYAPREQDAARARARQAAERPQGRAEAAPRASRAYEQPRPEAAGSRPADARPLRTRVERPAQTQERRVPRSSSQPQEYVQVPDSSAQVASQVESYRGRHVRG